MLIISELPRGPTAGVLMSACASCHEDEQAALLATSYTLSMQPHALV
jgi:cytochrome c553